MPPEILGFFKDGQYDAEQALQVKNGFQRKIRADTDEFAPQMLRAQRPARAGRVPGMMDYISGGMTFLFILVCRSYCGTPATAGRAAPLQRIRHSPGDGEENHIYRTSSSNRC